MLINELIKKLTEYSKVYGNIDVEYTNQGYTGTLEELDIIIPDKNSPFVLLETPY